MNPYLNESNFKLAKYDEFPGKTDASVRRTSSTIQLFSLKLRKPQEANKLKTTILAWQDILKRPAEEFGNDSMLEELWAKKAFEHAETHFNLLCSVDPRLLKLSPFDDIIFTAFRDEFPDLKVDVLNEDDLKNDLSKMKWRNFIERFNKLEDYSFGTLIRADASKEFSPENSIFVVRLQFLAIEIARNREGFNDSIRNKFGKNN
ncbi:CLUMA_CG006601, isoform A [Clunio marinus]|uniref:CLUMA_CG006601, isoform A n=1 Tax=Clunio marinus TaxID=568069 RepID=A0A1J1HYJ4_9DIPT|nr:CLUMA_CG006601, isoform A [Clunio marinus]